MNTVTSTIEYLKKNSMDLVTEYGLRIIIALLVLVIGWQLIKHLVKVADKTFHKSKMDESLSKFLLSAIQMGLKILLMITVIQQLDIPTTSLVAVIASAGIGVGLALQGSLANLTGGVIILFLRPFVVGDYIKETAYGNEGIVKDIQVLYTTLKTRDNKVITIPNGKLANESIVNYTKEDRRRVDLEFGVDYSEDIHKVKAAIRQVIDEHPLVLKDEEPFIQISEHADSSVKYLTLVWCVTKDYLQVKYDLIEKVKLKFDEENITIPYPHMDVKILNKE